MVEAYADQDGCATQSGTSQFHRLEGSSFENLSSTKKVTKNEPPKRSSGTGRTVTSFTANSKSIPAQCVLCTYEKHPLYAYPKLKWLPHEKISTLKENHLCMNYLNSGHFVKHCKSIHKCRKCQRPYHTLLHVEEGRPQHIRTVRTCIPFSPQQSYTNTAILLNYSDCVHTSL